MLGRVLAEGELVQQAGEKTLPGEDEENDGREDRVEPPIAKNQGNNTEQTGEEGHVPEQV